MGDPSILDYPVGVVVRHDMCVGCGVCAGVCPEHCFTMSFNEFGEYRPYPTSNPCTRCMLCLKACPFAPDNTPDEDFLAAGMFADSPGLQRSPALGFYSSCHVGHVADDKLRWKRTSGGLATWTLASLLRQGIVSAVYCVLATGCPNPRFAYARITDPAQLWTAATSAYYPVEVSMVLKTIRSTPEKAAIVALPCVAKGIRKAALYVPSLQERVALIAGLVCGQNKSTLYCDYLIRLAGLQEVEAETVSFREKTPRNPASRYAFVAKSSFPRNRLARLYWDDGPGYAWTHDYFKLNACNFCDDLFAEVADAAFMDAWLPRYIEDPSGTSITVVRSPLSQRLINEGVHSGELKAEPIDPAEVLKSQESGLRAKRELLAVRLALARQDPSWNWVKRAAPAQRVRRSERFLVRLRLRAQKVSKEAFLEQVARGPGLSHFNRRMRAIARRERLETQLRAIASIPRRAVSIALRTLRPSKEEG